jgi:hypothetical protein
MNPLKVKRQLQHVLHRFQDDGRCARPQDVLVGLQIRRVTRPALTLRSRIFETLSQALEHANVNGILNQREAVVI